MNLETNILIAGKSGVGKSEFINYIYGANKRASGAGRPVTGVGLYEETLELDGLTVNLYDSWGLEANKSKEWTKQILAKVAERDKSKNIKDWFHTIFYCFSASTARIEDFEKDDILKPLIKDGNKVIVIFTHCDVKGTESKIAGMKESLKSIGLEDKNIICVASKKKKLLNGSVKDPFGKEEVLTAIKSNLWLSIKPKIVNQYKSIITDTFQKWKNICISEIESNIKITNINNIEKKLLNTLSAELTTASTKISYQCSIITKDYCNYYNNLQNQLALTLYSSHNNGNYTDVSIDLENLLNISNEYFDINILKNVINIFLRTLSPIPLSIIIVPITSVIMYNSKKKEIIQRLKTKVNTIYNELNTNTDKIVLEFYKKLP